MLLALLFAVVIPPGHEEAISTLFRDLKLDHGCRVTAIRLQPDAIEAPLACDADETPVVRLVAREAAPTAPQLTHFAVTVAGAGPAGLELDLARQLGPRDVVNVWAPPSQTPAPTLPPTAKRTIGAVLIAWPLVELVRWARRRRA